MNPSTRLSLKDGSRYPALWVIWTEDEDGHGYIGVMKKWLDGDTCEDQENTITIRQTMPLGLILVEFEPCKGGCWKSARWEGATLTERDLQWATAWAELAKESYDECTRALKGGP